MPLKLKSIKPARDGIHKYKAIFTNDDRKYSVKFGAVGYSDFTIHKDEDRKERYLKRHKGMGEHWNQPDTPGALSRWVLWNLPTLKASIEDFKKRFDL
jgi:hypothetical protein